MREELKAKTYYTRKGGETFTIQLLIEDGVILNEGDLLIVEHDFTKEDFPQIQIYIERQE